MGAGIFHVFIYWGRVKLLGEAFGSKVRFFFLYYIISPHYIPHVHASFVSLCIFSQTQHTENSHSKVLKDIEVFLKLYEGQVDAAFETSFVSRFSDFYGEVIEWNNVKDVISTRELQRYTHIVGVITKYQMKTREVLTQFKTHVYDANVSEKDANIILSTVHASKGAEWENVQLLDDLSSLTVFQPKAPDPSNYFSSASSKKKNSSNGVQREWEFRLESWSDVLNLWYVGLTRARKNLAVPYKFAKLFDILKDGKWPGPPEPGAESSQNQGTQSEDYGLNEALREEITQCLCNKWRNDVGYGANNQKIFSLVD